MRDNQDIWDSLTRYNIRGKVIDAPDVLFREKTGWAVPHPNGDEPTYFLDKDYCGLASVSLVEAAKYAQSHLFSVEYERLLDFARVTPFPPYCAYAEIDDGGAILFVEFIFASVENEEGRLENYVFREKLGRPHKVKASKFKKICEKYYRYWLWFSSVKDSQPIQKIFQQDFDVCSKQFQMAAREVEGKIPTLANLHELVGYSIIRDQIEKPLVRHYSNPQSG